jgi:hypothetical protein
MSVGGRPWTEQEDAALTKAINEKVSLNRLAVRFKRSSAKISQRAKGMGLEIAKVKRLALQDRVYWGTERKI